MNTTLQAELTKMNKYSVMNFLDGAYGYDPDPQEGIMERLDELFELSIFITIKHFAFDRREKLIWKDNGFYHSKDTTGKEVVKLVIENMEMILGLKAAIQEKNNTNVFQMYLKLRDFNIQMVKESPFDGF